MRISGCLQPEPKGTRDNWNSIYGYYEVSRQNYDLQRRLNETLTNILSNEIPFSELSCILLLRIKILLWHSFASKNWIQFVNTCSFDSRGASQMQMPIGGKVMKAKVKVIW